MARMIYLLWKLLFYLSDELNVKSVLEWLKIQFFGRKMIIC